MRWLLHGAITPAVAQALARHGHQTQMPADIDLTPEASIPQVLESTNAGQLDLMTTDAKLAAAPFESGPRFTRCMVYLQLEGGEVEQDDAIDRLFARYKRLKPARLYTITASRVKVRQFPG